MDACGWLVLGHARSQFNYCAVELDCAEAQEHRECSCAGRSRAVLGSPRGHGLSQGCGWHLPTGHNQRPWEAPVPTRCNAASFRRSTFLQDKNTASDPGREQRRTNFLRTTQHAVAFHAARYPRPLLERPVAYQGTKTHEGTMLMNPAIVIAFAPSPGSWPNASPSSTNHPLPRVARVKQCAMCSFAPPAREGSPESDPSLAIQVTAENTFCARHVRPRATDRSHPNKPRNSPPLATNHYLPSPH